MEGLGGNMDGYNESSKNIREGQDLNQDLGKKSNEQWDSEKKSQEQCDWKGWVTQRSVTKRKGENDSFLFVEKVHNFLN